jgi:hypothetical protein
MENKKKCIWCWKTDSEITFNKKAHTIPKSLGGQNYNKNVCDECNEYFGATTKVNGYSIEEALKETFCLSRQRFLNDKKTKRQIGIFKSKFFDVKYRNGHIRIVVKQSFKFHQSFQIELCRNFKRGLVKMWFEEYDRQTKHSECMNEKYTYIRNFARYNQFDIPVLYFQRSIGIFVLTEREAETPVLKFGRMDYLIENEKFVEIEFLGHVFGIPKTICSNIEFDNYANNSIQMKSQFFKQAILIDKVTDIDFMLSVIDN